MNSLSNIERTQRPDSVAAGATEETKLQEEVKKIVNESAMNEDASAHDVGANEGEEERPVDDDPNWEEIMKHDPAGSEVPTFLAARGRQGDANTRFAAGLDVLHDSATQGMEGLAEVVTAVLEARARNLYEYEENLKTDYVYNEKTRASMHAKLEESARVAQGLFANLLKRVAQPEDVGRSMCPKVGAAETAENSGGRNGPNNANNDGGNEGGDQEPDWDAIMKHEPAQSEVPIFLAARGRREVAVSRFEAAIEEFQTSIDGYAQELTQTVADLYNARTMKLDEYEQILKHDYVANDKMRAKMQSSLEESATAAHKMFDELMKRVMQPFPQHQKQRTLSTGLLTQATTLSDSP